MHVRTLSPMCRGGRFHGKKNHFPCGFLFLPPSNNRDFRGCTHEKGKGGDCIIYCLFPPPPCFLNGTNFSVGLGRGEGSFILTNSFCSFLVSPAPRGSRRNISKKACFWHGREGEEGMTHRKKINNNNLFLLPLLTPSSFFSLLSSKPYVNICMLKGGRGEKKVHLLASLIEEIK